MTEEYHRPDPDEILQRIKNEEPKPLRGKLKIFLGYVAGVGKTYAMLEAAHQRKEEGVDVIVGYVETHGRKETEELSQGLEILARKEIDYRGMKMFDMDLDAILKRRPQLVLVDELAHSNVPGMRHVKRYQDVQEILAAGIDVYTTVNIQHLESLKDVIRQITGVSVRETVPDRVVDEAYEIEVIDLPTDELLNRLRDGKVYVTEQAARALDKFFRKGNLTALRELSLRRAAERVDDQMLSYMQDKDIQGPWPAGERILVCISSHPMGDRLIRTGCRLATDLNAEWYVVFVETPGHMRMAPQNKFRVSQNQKLAQELGARVENIAAESVADSVIEFARKHNVSKIVVGKPLRPRLSEFFGGSIVDRIIRGSGSIDVYVVSEGDEKHQKTSQSLLSSPFQPHRPLGRYLISTILVILMTLLGFPLHGRLDPTNLVMLYLLAVVFSGLFLGRGPSILASFLSVLAFDFFFVEPRFTFTVYDTQYLLTFAGLLLVGLIISNSASLLRDQVDALRRRQVQSQQLNNLSRDLTASVTLEQVLETIIRNLGDLLNQDTVILLPENGKLMAKASTPGFSINESEVAVADWSFKNSQEAGRDTNTLPASPVRFIPLITSHGTVGILGTRLGEGAELESEDRQVFLEGVVNLAAIAIERSSLAEKAAQAEMLRTTEKLQNALINSISHELRTPLATVTGVLSGLMEADSNQPINQFDPVTRLELIQSAYKQAGRLNHLVENLLDMTRLESGTLRLVKEPTDIQDLIGAVTVRMADELSDHPIKTEIPEDLPAVPLDSVLIAQVLENLLDNAGKYSPSGKSITIQICLREDAIEIAVRDDGLGIPSEDLERVFDKFFRVQRKEQVAGTGLGLSICKGIIEAHGGRIWATNNSKRGVSVAFTLPLQSPVVT
jgi:two-component system sensor histidine kinase KdpD